MSYKFKNFPNHTCAAKYKTLRAYKKKKERNSKAVFYTLRTNEKKKRAKGLFDIREVKVKSPVYTFTNKRACSNTY